MKTPPGAALYARPCQPSSSWVRQQEKLKSYCKVSNYLLATYAMDDIIVEADMNIMSLKQPAGPSKVKYVQALWTKAVGCVPSCDKHFLN